MVLVIFVNYFDVLVLFCLILMGVYFIFVLIFFKCYLIVMKIKVYVLLFLNG